MYHITLLEGDGIGSEVIAEAIKVLEVIAEKHGLVFHFERADVGGIAIDNHDSPFPDSTLQACLRANAVLLGAVGGPKWDNLPKEKRPETGLLAMRKALNVFANLRPVAVDETQAHRSSLKHDIVVGTDLLVVRELVGGIYFGTPSFRNDFEGVSTDRYTTPEIERIARVAFAYARKRRNKVTSVDKANVLQVSMLWRDVVHRIHAEEFADVQLEDMYVDNAAMQLILHPRQFDVILTNNMFGDILSDAAAVLPGSLGMLPSASIGAEIGLFEPCHGSAPDIAGKGIANPIAAILSAAMMLDFLGEVNAANDIRASVDMTLQSGAFTADLAPKGTTALTRSQMGDLIAANI